MAPHRVRDGRVTRDLGVEKDVTERVAAAARIHRLAQFDHLTGLPNRATLHDELRSALHRARVRDLQVALLAIDLDDFKRVYDRGLVIAAARTLIARITPRVPATLTA